MKLTYEDGLIVGAKREREYWKNKIEKKVAELSEGIKRDMINYDKVKEENWKKAIYKTMHNKIDTKKVLQELLEED